MSRLCLLLLAISSFENIIAGVIPSGFECSDNTKLAVAEALNIADREIMTTEHSAILDLASSPTSTQSICDGSAEPSCEGRPRAPGGRNPIMPARVSSPARELVQDDRAHARALRANTRPFHRTAPHWTQTYCVYIMP